jgi:RNA polymerase sigma-70 factor (ECF subfamily)
MSENIVYFTPNAERIPAAPNTFDRDRRTAELSEDRLVKLAQGGDRGAFQELVSRTQKSCLAVAIGILGDRDDAADEVQNAFWRAYTRIDTFRQQALFSTWVTRILVNLCYMRLRRASRIRFVPYDGISSEGHSYNAYDAIDQRTPEGRAGDGEVRELLRSEVQRIPRLLRDPLELYYLEDIPIDEVARQLKLSVSATKSRLHRAQIYLRKRMIRHCGMHGSATLLN